MDLGIHPLHGQVRALDDADLDARAAGIDARGRPLLETLKGTEGVGQVGLEDDAGLVAVHVRLVEDGGEHGDREIQVLVILHVEVQEGPAVACESVEGRQGAHAMGDDLVEAPGVVRAGDRGDLDGDVVDVLARDEAGDLGEAVGGFLLSEDGLAQEVDVEAVSACAQAGERRAEALVRRVDDEVTDDLTEDSARDGRHAARRQARRARSEAHGGGERRGQEVLAPPCQFLEGCAGHVEVRGTHDVVDETGGERQAVRVGEDPGEQLRGLRCGFVGRLVCPAARSGDGPLPQFPQVIGALASLGAVRAGSGWGGNGGVRHAWPSRLG